MTNYRGPRKNKQNVSMTLMETLVFNFIQEQGYITMSDLPPLFSGSYTDLTNKPTIPLVLRTETFSGVTNASGQFTVTYSTPYSVIPDVQPQLTAGTPSQVARITSNSVNGFTVTVTNRASVNLLGIDVLLAATVVVASAPISVLVTARS